MASGSFFPFTQYNEDLTRSMSGLCQIYPSRHVTIQLDGDDVKAWVDEADAACLSIRQEADTPLVAAYGRIRGKLYEKIYKHVVVNGTESNIKAKTFAPAMGEINFISHELRDGWMYNDIYVHVTPDEGKNYIVLQEKGFADEPDRTGFDFDITTNEYRKFASDRKNIEFNAVILYYNLHMIDPTSKTADTQPVIIDMPLGIYVLPEKAAVQMDNSAVYGQGAAWSTRIVSRIASAGTIANAQSDRNREYATLGRVLSEFGDIAEVMDRILHRREVVATQNQSARSTDSINMAAPEDIKAYLEEFRRLNAVNVPYIKDNHWFVNGRDLGPVSGNVDWTASFNEWFNSLPEDDRLKIFKGEKGDPGKDGSQGKKGDKGDKGDPGINGINGSDGPKGEDGHSPVVYLDTDAYLVIDGIKQSTRLMGPAGLQGPRGIPGPQGNPGRDGRNGETGPQGPQGIQGPKGEPGTAGGEGAKGDPGTNGKDGHSPKVELSDDGYLLIDDVKQPTCLIGPKGEDAKVDFYGWTNSALKSDGTLFEPTSQSTSTTGIKPQGTPNLSVEHLTASTTQQYVWKFSGGEWVLDNWKYVSAVEAVMSGIETVAVTGIKSLGGVILDTNIEWAVQKSTFGDLSDVAVDGYYLSCGRKDKFGTKYYTISDVFYSLFESIKSNSEGFKWSDLIKTYGNSAAFLPFSIRFANADFFNICCHDAQYDNTTGELKSLILVGRFSLHSNRRAFQTGSHPASGFLDIKFDCNMTIYLNSSYGLGNTDGATTTNKGTLSDTHAANYDTTNGVAIGNLENITEKTITIG